MSANSYWNWRDISLDRDATPDVTRNKSKRRALAEIRQRIDIPDKILRGPLHSGHRAAAMLHGACCGRSSPPKARRVKEDGARCIAGLRHDSARSAAFRAWSAKPNMVQSRARALRKGATWLAAKLADDNDGLVHEIAGRRNRTVIDTRKHPQCARRAVTERHTPPYSALHRSRNPCAIARGTETRFTLDAQPGGLLLRARSGAGVETSGGKYHGRAYGGSGCTDINATTMLRSHAVLLERGRWRPARVQVTRRRDVACPLGAAMAIEIERRSRCKNMKSG